MAKNNYSAALAYLESCGGDCKHCDKCRVVTSKNALYYAYTCDAAPDAWILSDTMHELHAAAIEYTRNEMRA